eukprot:TRINITY_DN633_c1_g2_i3.p1 TRINITY_DN633_c1_g2~~TRINITY_DN633_c1_g2_i3.p1  ORF type:complete len:214 (+),score=31.79 TRINITY_DN633_c1_g2_i3:202-843(+)
MSRLAALGISKVVSTASEAAAATVVAGGRPTRRRKLMSGNMFPKGKGSESLLSRTEDKRVAVPVSVVSKSEGSGGTKLTALQKRMQQSTKEVMVITENAANVIHQLLSERDDNPIGVRLGVVKKGCNGLAYTMDYLYPSDTENKSKFSSSTTQHGVTVLIDPDAFMYVVGTVMDYHITKSSEEFVFLNPNSEGECGCGQSWVPKKDSIQAAAA